MKTMEERIKEIKRCADCAIHCMDNHTVEYVLDNSSLDPIINSMHIAKNKDALSEAYYNYINTCIGLGYSDGDIIAGIMQNETKNKEFEVNIESVIKSFINIKYTTIKLSEPVISKEKPVVQPQPAVNPEKPSNGIKVNDKIISKISKKVDYMNGLLGKLKNDSSNQSETINAIKKIAEETKQMIVSVDPTSCSEETIASLNDNNAAIEEALKVVSSVENAAKQVVSSQTTNAQQPAVAHTQGGFNIGNFIKEAKPVKGPTMPSKANPQPPKQTAFPHQICGLTDDQIVAEVGKHFKVLESIPAYPLYDLLNNKLLGRKMKELDAKQRPNNPYLTQVNINEYIDVPELLAKYTLAFTMPCNDKKQIIVVLFNPTPEPDKNGVLHYPIHILKAAKTNANK